MAIVVVTVVVLWIYLESIQVHYLLPLTFFCMMMVVVVVIIVLCMEGVMVVFVATPQNRVNLNSNNPLDCGWLQQESPE